MNLQTARWSPPTWICHGHPTSIPYFFAKTDLVWYGSISCLWAQLRSTLRHRSHYRNQVYMSYRLAFWVLFCRRRILVTVYRVLLISSWLGECPFSAPNWTRCLHLSSIFPILTEDVCCFNLANAPGGLITPCLTMTGFKNRFMDCSEVTNLCTVRRNHFSSTCCWRPRYRISNRFFDRFR